MRVLRRGPQRARRLSLARYFGAAAGCQLVAACDLAVAAGGTRFAAPGVDRALLLDADGGALAGRRPQTALEMVLTGSPIDVSLALEWGLVNKVVPAEELDEAVSDLVAAIAASSPLTLAIGKDAFYAQIELDERQAYELTKTVMATNALACDGQEGMCAFLQKRTPAWTGE